MKIENSSGLASCVTAIDVAGSLSAMRCTRRLPRKIVDPDLGARILVRVLTADVHQAVEPSRAGVQRQVLHAARPPRGLRSAASSSDQRLPALVPALVASIGTTSPLNVTNNQVLPARTPFSVTGSLTASNSFGVRVLLLRLARIVELHGERGPVAAEREKRCAARSDR